MQTHNIKLNHNYADAVMNGDKNFEIRYNDRGYQRGDRVIFTVVNDSQLTVAHPLNREAFTITYLVHGYGLQDNWCVFGIKPFADKEDDT